MTDTFPPEPLAVNKSSFKRYISQYHSGIVEQWYRTTTPNNSDVIYGVLYHETAVLETRKHFKFKQGNYETSTKNTNVSHYWQCLVLLVISSVGEKHHRVTQIKRYTGVVLWYESLLSLLWCMKSVKVIVLCKNKLTNVLVWNVHCGPWWVFFLFSY